MATMLKSAIERLLPTETISHILKDLWESTSSPAERKELYETIGAASPRLRDILVLVAMRYVVIDTAGFKTDDIELYKSIARHAASLSGLPPLEDETSEKQRVARLFDSYGDPAWGTGTPHRRPYHYPHAAVFPANAHVRLDGFALYRFDDERHRFDASETQSWSALLTTVRALLGADSCTSFTLATPTTASRSPVLKQAVPALLFWHLLRHLPALASLRLDCYFEPLYSTGQACAPIPLPHVTFLRLTHHPACECSRDHRDQWSPRRRADGHLKTCLAVSLLEAFPSLVALHIENPVFLKNLAPPRSLRTLTIEAPPVVHIAGREAYSSIVEYNVASAVRRGFMCGPRSSSTSSPSLEAEAEAEAEGREIVVLTGRANPLGWSVAQKACEEKGVTLVKVIAFPEVVHRPDLQSVTKGKGGLLVSRP